MAQVIPAIKWVGTALKGAAATSGGQAAIGAAAGAGVSKALSSDPKMPDINEPDAPDTEGLEQNERLAAQRRAARQTGRMSTFMTDKSGTLG